VIRPVTISLLAVIAIALEASSASGLAVEDPIVVTQVPRARAASPDTPWEAGVLRTDYGDGARIVLVRAGELVRVLTEDFHSAADPDISFDGRRMLFAARRVASDDWNIFEMELDGRDARQITRDLGDCRQPVYQGTLYTIVSTEPWHQITFVSTAPRELNEHGSRVSTSLYSCTLDGSEVQRLTYNPSADLDPAVLPDGRLVFSSWQRSTRRHGPEGRISLFTAHTDGLDYALFSGDEGLRVKLMPAVTTDGLVVFVEGDEVASDGSGSLASVSLRRNLHSYQRITGDRDGLFHSPSALADGMVLVSHRARDGRQSLGVYRMDPGSARMEAVFDDPQYDDVQARAVAPRPEPDGRSSVVKPANPSGTLYCLNAFESDLPTGQWPRSGTPLRLRVLEGIPRRAAQGVPAADKQPPPPGGPPLLARRFLGEIDVEDDGSFNIKVPPNIPIELQLIDADGLALRSCSWIWVRNNETRGCIGCHEDGERTPENRFVQAVRKPSIGLTLSPQRRRSVDYQRDVVPILSGTCAGCHDEGLAYDDLLRSVRPGRARTSPLVWHLLDRVTVRPWDRAATAEAKRWTPPDRSVPMSAHERQTILEWIDLGAQGDER
jgi:Tol biopolymer transport system component